MGSTVESMKTIPDGYTTVTPWLISTDTAQELEFIAAAFDGQELARVVGDDGTIGHAETRIGDAIVMLFDARPGWPATPCFLRLYVEDADETFRRAQEAGAKPVTVPTELFWGDKVGRVRDPLGNLWWIQQRVAEPTPEEAAERMSDPKFVAAMEYVTSSDPFAS
jgi:PhnB protein